MCAKLSVVLRFIYQIKTQNLGYILLYKLLPIVEILLNKNKFLELRSIKFFNNIFFMREKVTLVASFIHQIKAEDLRYTIANKNLKIVQI